MPSPEEDIQHALKSCSIVQELRSDFDDIKEARNVFQMEGKGAETNFTITQLANPQCFAVPPLTLASVKGRTVIAIHYIGPGMAGHPGIMHGGAIATILDECCGKAATTHFEALNNEAARENGTDATFDPKKGVLAVTAQLTVEYKNATRTGSALVTHATVDKEKSSERKAVVTAQMLQANPEEPDKYNVVATANGLFIKPRALA